MSDPPYMADWQLPLPFEETRIMPNALARSALFTARRSPKLREWFKRAEVVSLSGLTVKYTGEELRQDDLDVWLQVVRIGQQYPLGASFPVRSSEVLSMLGLSHGGPQYERLRQSIARMVAGTIYVDFEAGVRESASHLIQRYDACSEDPYGTPATPSSAARTVWMMELDPRITRIFAGSGHTLLDWRQRRQLTTLAKWVHSFLSTHRYPMPYSVERLRLMCASRDRHARSFRQSLREALAQLLHVGFLLSWTIDDADIVRVVRNLHEPIEP